MQFVESPNPAYEVIFEIGSYEDGIFFISFGEFEEFSNQTRKYYKSNVNYSDFEQYFDHLLI